MKGLPEERAVSLAAYIIENNATVRKAATVFHISKSTVHKDVSERLKKLNPQLYVQVKKVLDINKQERHIRGGMATRRKYLLYKSAHDEKNAVK
ncbi:MAG: sporulation transcriptional regulator SpoIIID [Candidatus Pararuminococcus gallinarum]|uniref:sporulation transcriptional regulator SpoIIID n=1 Tax=Zongyangia sp. HA2173 TaxID=3133035 RepID=UPI00174988D4